MQYILKTDGGSRGNPGASAGGAVLYDAGGNVLSSIGMHYGVKTNNQAEYMALKMGVEHAVAYFRTNSIYNYQLKILMDSELIVKQIKGIYRVRDYALGQILREVKKILPNGYAIYHIYREENKDADRIVNLVLDGKYTHIK